MSSKYSLEAFNQDMAQLGGMIENFYTHTGGARKKKPKTKNVKTVKKVKRGGKESDNEITDNEDVYNSDDKLNKRKVSMLNTNKRYYKITTVNETPYPFNNKRYSGAEPKDAAKKAGKFICKKLKINKPCNITFELKETTRGSDKRLYGPYEGHFDTNLKKPTVKIFPGGKKFTAYKNGVFVVKLAKK
jgi:hypothetical protein